MSERVTLAPGVGFPGDYFLQRHLTRASAKSEKQILRLRAQPRLGASLRMTGRHGILYPGTPTLST